MSDHDGRRWSSQRHRHAARHPGLHRGRQDGHRPQARRSTGGYKDAAGNYHYVATFAGFVPAEDPELSIIVVLDEPTASIYGGEVAAPVFAQLAQYALPRYRIPPPAAGRRRPPIVPEPRPTGAGRSTA